jgi:ParB family transcriptional regulator, chromosome partitioning protein
LWRRLSVQRLVRLATVAAKRAAPFCPRNRYTEIRTEKPASKDDGKQPEFKVCKFAREAIITDGSERGELRKVCSEPSCPVHHPERSTNRNSDDKWKAEREKWRRDEAIANATGIRVLTAIGQAVHVRLLKRDLQFVTEKLAALLDERRLEVLARQHGIKRTKDAEAIDKLFTAFVRRADEVTLGAAAG